MKINTTLTALVIGLASAAVTQALPPGPLVSSPNPVFISGSTAFRAQVYAGLQRQQHIHLHRHAQ
jgi:hypothetical protein